jgi:[acyl-carrier-protein] S-malonyltransferase/trans-AT polyketide synthase/acyltransferase/oxidoreductase domain-containing protein
MGKDFYDEIPVCRQTYEEAADALDLDIAAICFDEDARLNLTEYTQPCIATTEIAMLRGLAERYGFVAECFGGHSLGEFTALVAADVIPFANTVQIVRERGKLMQTAVPMGVGSMAAVISEGIDIEGLKKILADLPIDISLTSKSEIHIPHHRIHHVNIKDFKYDKKIISKDRYQRFGDLDAPRHHHQ